MNRRRVLALLGTAAFGGCLGSSEPDGFTTRTTTPVETNTSTAATDQSSTDETTSTVDAPTLGTRNPEGCPAFDSDVTRVVCSPAVGDDAPMALAPAEQSGSLPRATFSFTLTNGTDAKFMINFYHWRVWKRVEGEWFHVTPQTYPEPLMWLRPGDSHAWELTVDNTDLDRRIDSPQDTERVTVVGLGPGTYAFGVDGWFEDRSYQNGTGFAARFELSGDPLELTPVGIDTVEREGDTVVLRDDPDSDDEDEPRSRYVVTRVESAPEEPRRMITEQVIRDTPLRNALAHFEAGVRRVELVAPDGTFPPFGIEGRRYVEYEGETYRIETERAETTTER